MGCSEQNPDCGNSTRHPVPSTTVKKKKKKKPGPGNFRNGEETYK